jgi:methionine aminopeptidase
METNQFDLEILNELGIIHKKLMNELKIIFESNYEKFETNKDIWNYINDYINDNGLKKAFPIGISINQIIAHDSYHESNLKKLKKGDFIKIDVGLIEQGNIIDCARTFVYGDSINNHKCINDCKEIFLKVEEFIRKEIELKGKILIQRISAYTNAMIVSLGYESLNFLGGHTIEYGKVHGKHVILLKPLTLLPKEAALYIDSNAEIGENEMFAIEIYIGEKKATGQMIKNSVLPVTHFEVLDKKELEKIKLSKEEKDVINSLKDETNGLVYEHVIHSNYKNKIIKNLIDKNAIIKHEPLEFVSNSKEKIKYIQYEDCFLIKNGELINLSK